jgi:predicted Zn-ribbon and HTH transcriptional regulator
MTYAEQLKNPKWQRKRLETLEYYGFRCKACGNEDEQLDIHHGAYLSGHKIWDYHVWELHVLCRTCHKELSSDIYAFNKALALMEQSKENYELLTKFAEIINLTDQENKDKIIELLKDIPY